MLSRAISLSAEIEIETEAAKPCRVHDRNFSPVTGHSGNQLKKRKDLNQGFWTKSELGLSCMWANLGFTSRSSKQTGSVQ